MDLLSIFTAGIVSFIVTLFVNLTLDKLRNKAKNKLDQSVFLKKFVKELVLNFNKLENNTILEIEAIKELISQEILSVEKKKLKLLLNSITFYNEQITSKNQIPNNQSLKREMLDIFSEHSISNGIKIGIINSPQYHRSTGGVFGHYGIAPPSFYKEHLINFECCYISPLNYDKIRECDMVINPYGEAIILKNIKKKNAIEEMLYLLDEFLNSGGIWLHTGGLPFYIIADQSGKQLEKIGSKIIDHYDFPIIRLTAEAHQELKYTDEGKYIFEDLYLQPGLAYRLCTNADKAWIKVNNETLLGLKKIGSGGIAFYGILHTKTTLNESPDLLIKLINYLFISIK